MPHPIPEASRSSKSSLLHLFLGQAPLWYKQALILCLIINPLLLVFLGPFVTGWCILIEFIATLALALKCYPLQTGGLLVLEAAVLGLIPLPAMHEEVARNMPVLFLVLFVVTAVAFLKELLALIFTRVILWIQNKALIAFLFLILSAGLSALLDALTVMAVIITVLSGLYASYHRFASDKEHDHEHDYSLDHEIHEHHREDLREFRSFLRGILMHSAVGTMLGGVLTLIGEPQNLLISKVMGWNFHQFFLIMSPVTLPVLFSGILLCFVLERMRWSDFGAPLSPNIRLVLEREAETLANKRTQHDKSVIKVQALGALFLICSLVTHVTEVYLVGLSLLVIVTAFSGITDEHRIGQACKEGAPFVFVLAVFFGIVAMIHAQHLFLPVTEWVLSFEAKERLLAYYGAAGLLSAISDNVFVASLYIKEAEQLFQKGALSRAEYEAIAIAINTGTNIPSIATPNGQAAFLFLLTSPLAPLVRLSYGRMVVLALPYALVTTVVGALGIWYLL